LVIYFIQNFKGGGMTHTVFDENHDMYITLYFNPEILRTTISEWINIRDNSMFCNDYTEYSVSIEISDEYNALLYILLHELSHVYDIYNNITPYTEPDLKKISSTSKNASQFINGIWEDYCVPVDKYDYLHDYTISFYGIGGGMSNTKIMEIYQNINKTPFVSVYGSQNWAEDFAEVYTCYYLETHFGIEYKIKIYRNNILQMEYSPNDNDLVKRRHTIFKNIK
jgi:hypothetical protein